MLDDVKIPDQNGYSPAREAAPRVRVASCVASYATPFSHCDQGKQSFVANVPAFLKEPLCVRMRMRVCVGFPKLSGTSGTYLSISLLLH
jgi:hypothetical protein